MNILLKAAIQQSYYLLDHFPATRDTNTIEIVADKPGGSVHKHKRFNNVFVVDIGTDSTTPDDHASVFLHELGHIIFGFKPKHYFYPFGHSSSSSSVFSWNILEEIDCDYFSILCCQYLGFNIKGKFEKYIKLDYNVCPMLQTHPLYAEREQLVSDPDRFLKYLYVKYGMESKQAENRKEAIEFFVKDNLKVKELNK